jgi:hypothetical protein
MYYRIPFNDTTCGSLGNSAKVWDLRWAIVEREEACEDLVAPPDCRIDYYVNDFNRFEGWAFRRSSKLQHLALQGPRPHE